MEAHSQHGKRWLPEHDGFLLRHIEQEDQIIAHILERTAHAVACRRIRLAMNFFKESPSSFTTFSECLQHFHANPELAEKMHKHVFQRANTTITNTNSKHLVANPLISLGALEQIAMHIMRDLGAGYSESIYQHALFHQLFKIDPTARMEVSMPVMYEGEVLGTCRADIVTGGYVIEIKAVRSLTSSLKQIQNQIRKYLRHIEIAEGGGRQGIVINFNQDNEQLDFLHFKP